MATLEEFFDFFVGRRATEVLIEEVLGFFWPLLLNFLAFAVYNVGSREPALWTYFNSEKVCQAIFWTSVILKVIYLLACFVLTWKKGRRHTLLPTLFWTVYMTGLAVGCHSSTTKHQKWEKFKNFIIRLQIKYIYKCWNKCCFEKNSTFE